MSDDQNYKRNSCGFSEPEIRAKAASTQGKTWVVHCLNLSAHKHADKHPSAFYYPETGWYGCNVCELKGFASDRFKKDKVKRIPNTNGQTWAETAVYQYVRTDGTIQHRIRRLEADAVIESDIYPDKITKQKKFVAENCQGGFWDRGKGTVSWQPYQSHRVDSSKRVWIVEGEKCADELQAVLPDDEVATTSAFGSASANKTDWGCIKDKEHSVPIMLLPDADKAGEKYIQDVVKELGNRQYALIRMPADCHDIADYVKKGRKISELREEPYLLSGTMNDLSGLEQKPVKWLWKDMLPKGKLTLLVAQAGYNKSTFAYWLAAQLSRGGINQISDEPKRTAIYSTEDTPADIMAPKVARMGGDLHYVDWIGSPERGGGKFQIGNPYHIERLHEAVDDYSLIVFDPIISVCGNQNPNNASVVRHALERVVEPILAKGVAVLGIHHERKDVTPHPQENLVDRALGSQAWSAEARIMWLMSKSPIDECSEVVKKRDLGTNTDSYGMIAPVKSNVSQIGFAYHLEFPVIDDVVTVQMGERFEATGVQALAQYRKPTRIRATEQLAEAQLKEFREVQSKRDKARMIAIGVLRQAPNCRMLRKQLIDEVIAKASVSPGTTRRAIDDCTKSVQEGKEVWRILLPEFAPNE